MHIIPFIIIAIPIIASLFFRWNVKSVSLISGFIEMALSTLLYFQMPFHGIFYVDFTEWIFLMMVSSIYTVSVFYSIYYMKDIESRGISEEMYFVLMNLFTASMLFSLLMNNYGFMWVGIEATTISSALLIIAEKNDISLEAAWRYIILVSAGVTFAFISIILIYYNFHTLNVYDVIHSGPQGGLIIRVIVSIALVGFGTKTGVFPVHTWLPDAHSEAPPPVSAMFSGVLLPVALYVLYRIYQIAPYPQLYTWFAVISIAAASIFLANQRKYKRMFAYSTMENMNVALLGLALGGVGVTGALLVLVTHSFAKSASFFSSGNILKSTGSKDMDHVRGIWKGMPYTSTALLLSSFAVTGAPPFGVFIGEFIILYRLATVNMIQFALVLFFLMAAFIGINQNVTSMVFNGTSDHKESGWQMPAIALACAVISLLLGIVFLGGYFNALL
jgi:hydrogenase-4 component F